MEESDLKFGGWRLDPHGNQLHNGKQSCRLEPKPLRLLIYLLAHAGELVRKESLLADIWAGRVVNEDVISVAVSQLRKAFGDDARNPAYIKTVPGVGYQFIFPVNNAEKKSARNHLRVLQGNTGEELTLGSFPGNVRSLPFSISVLFVGFSVLQILIVLLTIMLVRC